MAKIKFRVEGMEKLQKDLKRIGDVPQKHVTASARRGMTISLRQARSEAPEGDTGSLKKGIVLKGERSRFKGKKVYRIVFDRRMNHIFQKPNKEGKITGYYPISQEYGFFARDGRYIPGFRFMHDSLNDNSKAIEKTIIKQMQKRVDSEITKVGLK